MEPSFYSQLKFTEHLLSARHHCQQRVCISSFMLKNKTVFYTQENGTAEVTEEGMQQAQDGEERSLTECEGLEAAAWV